MRKRKERKHCEKIGINTSKPIAFWSNRSRRYRDCLEDRRLDKIPGERRRTQRFREDSVKEAVSKSASS